jgi:short-subunit dehydrogenase
VRIEGKVAVVTGADRGIGRATAIALANRGAKLLLACRDEPDLEQVAAETGGVLHVVDVSVAGHADGIVDAARDRFGRLDIVVANAGIGHAGQFVDMAADQIDALIDVNVIAPVQLAKAAVPDMVKRGEGAVVFITSIAGLLPLPTEAVYSMTKASIETFAEALREEVRAAGVQVSTIAPAVVATQFFEKRGAPYTRRFPRPMPPERIAAAVVNAIENNRRRVIMPPWLALPVRLQQTMPSVYRTLARGFS